MHLRKLQKTFTKFIENNHRLPVFAPAFFAEDMLKTSPDHSWSPIAQPLPFDKFWLVYETDNGIIGTISNMLLIQDHVARLFVVLRTPIGTQKPIEVCNYDLRNPRQHSVTPGHGSQAVPESLPEIRVMLDRINFNERSTINDRQLDRINRVRVARGNPAIPPYIVLTNVLKPVEAEPQGGTHASPRGHDRRGHWRTYKKTGKRTWIEAMKINGGGGGGRDYVV